MSRYIDADVLLENYKGNILTAQTDYAQGARDIIDDIKNAPTVEQTTDKWIPIKSRPMTEDVASIIHAEWVLNSFPGSGEYVCSNCRKLEYFPSRSAKNEYKYCPYCGAEMEKTNEI